MTWEKKAQYNSDESNPFPNLSPASPKKVKQHESIQRLRSLKKVLPQLIT